MENVVLLHGLARTSNSMALLALALQRAGYNVTNLSYPSSKDRVETLAEGALSPALSQLTGKVHFVTHSMGGILLRSWLRDNRPEELGRTVMLGPPNQGSEIVDAFVDLAPFEWINGPAGMQLGTESQLLANLGDVDFELGVIAGKLPLNPFYAAIIEGENDGKVSVASTKVEGMSDHLVLNASHTWMTMNPLVMAQTMNFLAEGRFDADMTYAEALIKTSIMSGA